MFIIRRSELHCTASGIITPIGDRFIHRCVSCNPEEKRPARRSSRGWDDIIKVRKNRQVWNGDRWSAAVSAVTKLGFDKWHGTTFPAQHC